MNEAKNQVNDLEHKKKTSNHYSKKKKESKNSRTVQGASGTISNGPTFPIIEVPEREEKK